MSVYSKFLDEVVRNQKCATTFHPNQSCLEYAMRAPARYILSNMKYFGPVVLISLLTKIKKMNLKTIRSFVIYYAQLVCTGALVGMAITSTVCSLRHLYNKLYVFLLWRLPSLMAALIVFKAPMKVQTLFITTVNQCYIDSIIIQQKNFITKLLHGSRFARTLLFMFCSAIIMQAIQDKNYSGFWFLDANPKLVTATDSNTDPADTQQNCVHPGSTCSQHWYNGTRSYFLLGLSLDLIKTLIAKASGENVYERLFQKLANLNWESTSFLTSYMATYRLTHCLLRRYLNNREYESHLLAAFFASSSYYLQPKQMVLSYAIVQSIQILWNKLILKYNNNNKSNRMLQMINKLPFPKLIFIYTMTCVIFWNVFRRKHYSTEFTHKMVNGITGNFAKRVRSFLDQAETAYFAKFN